jgi:hypothetical protein
MGRPEDRKGPRQAVHLARPSDDSAPVFGVALTLPLPLHSGLEEPGGPTCPEIAMQLSHHVGIDLCS